MFDGPVWRASDGDDVTARARASLVIGVATLMLATACSLADPDAPSRAKLDELVRRKATRGQLAAALGSGYSWSAPGTPEWQALQDFLGREDARVYAPVVQAMRDKRYIMYYTTMWQQTWLFLDEGERLESYWTNTQ